MRKTVIFLSILVVIMSACGQKTAQEFYDENFKWKITIPEKLKATNSEKWAKSRERGMQAIEDTYGEGIEDYTVPIFTFNNGQFNVFEAVYEDFDPEIDGDFFETCKLVNEMMYETFITQMPNTVVDTLTAVEQIDNLDFYVFKIKVTYPNGIILNMLMYSRLFNKQSFGLNIIYRDEEIGHKMLEAWKKSTFGK
jgi:Na+-transporting methylmalonyl-CoA/oxaloacetate decarboxylase gamma subunit